MLVLEDYEKMDNYKDSLYFFKLIFIKQLTSCTFTRRKNYLDCNMNGNLKGDLDRDAEDIIHLYSQ